MEKDGFEGSAWAVIVAVSLAMVALISLDLGADDLIGGDEGYYGVMARNILEDPGYIPNTSLSPLGPPGDKPFLFPLVLAGSLAAGGTGEVPMRLVTLLFAASAGILLFLAGTGTGDRRAGLFAGLIYLFTPLLANTGRNVAAEPMLVSLALAAFCLTLAAARGRRPVYGFAAGALFGLAFLTKLWLVAIPMAGAAGGILFYGLTSSRRTAGRIVAGASAGFLLTGSLQLVLCLVFSPETFRHWLGIYGGFSLADRVSGGTFASYWHHPWYFYLLLIGRSAGQWLVLVPVGIAAVIARLKRSPAGSVILAWLVPLAVMSMMPVKSGNYILPVMPAVFLLAGYGISLLLNGGGGRPFSGKVIAAAAAAGFALCLLVQIDPDGGSIRLHSPAMLLIQGVMAAAVLTAASPRLSGRTGRRAVAAALVIAAAGGMLRDIQIVRSRNHVTGLRKAAQALAPGLEGIDPARRCFYSPEWPSVSFYTFRSGGYWESPYGGTGPGEIDRSLDGPPCFYIVPESPVLYGGMPDSLEMAAIISKAEIFDVPAGDTGAGLTIYVNRSLAVRLSR